MKKISIYLTEHMILKGTIEARDYYIYQYGLQTLMEISINILFSLIIAAYFHMIPECILFFLVFIPLRSYAGGFHCKTYFSCFICSCCLLIAILYFVKYMTLTPYVYHVIFAISMVGILKINIVADTNKPLDQDEQSHFRKRCNQTLCILLGSYIFLWIVPEYTAIVSITVMAVMLSMIAGKIKNLRHTKHSCTPARKEDAYGHIIIQ